MSRRDPNAVPFRPRNVRGMWRCDHCSAWNDPEIDICWKCEVGDQRPQVSELTEAE